MPQAALTAVVFAAQAIGTAASATAVAVAGASAATLAAGAALASIAYTSYSAKKAAADARKDSARAPRDITVRSAIEPARIIYGTARTSGPVVYTNTAPTPGTNDNSTLWTVISLCQHEIEDITEIWLDGDQILSSAIDWAGTGGVTSGKYGPIGGNEVTNFYRRFGTDTQTHVTELATAFGDWTSAYDGKGVAYIVTAFELGTATGEGVWAQGAPQNIRAVVKGKKVYDPRKDSTQTGGSGAHRLADPTTWEWSDNPALCLADYLFDARLGMGAEGVTYDDIDWDLVADAADVCDVSVTIPGGSEKRFTCNGALSTGETYAENIKQLLSSMSGQITWSGGKYRIRAAAYEAPTYTFTGDDVIGDVQIQPERTRTQRYNKIRGTYIDPSSDYVATEFIPVENTSYKNTRDGGQTLSQEIRLPFTNSEYMAQRIAFKQLNLNNQQLRCIVPFNWKAMKVAVGDRIQLSIEELSWSNKVFRVDGWSFSPDSGFNLTLQEDSSSAYADPLLAEYSTRTLAGTVSFADQAVSAPSGLQATSEEEAILLEWEAPPRASGYDEVIVFASASSAWSGASEIARTRGNTYRHELTNGTTRYYWVRAVDVDGRLSTRNPDSDTSTVTATAGQISTSQLNDDANFALTANWPDITGTGKPEDDATVGATVGTNTYDTDGTTVLGTTELKNSVNKGKTLALLLNQEVDGTANAGKISLVGVDNEGEIALDTDGFFNFDGTKYTVDAASTSGPLPYGNYTSLTSQASKKGYFAYNITNGYGALVWRTAGTWYFDDGSSAQSFTPDSSILALGYLETDASGNPLYGGLLAEPVHLVGISEIVADYISAGTIDASVISVTNLTADNITAGTIDADRLSVDGVTIDTNGTGQLIIKDGGVDSTQLADGAVTAGKIGNGEVSIAKFASGITPVQVVDTLPGTATQGDQAFLTTDNKLYRYNGTAWVNAVDGADVTSGTLPASAIVANSITAGEIAAGAIGADEIAANAVTADKIDVTNLAAITADLGTVTAGSLAAGLITGDVNENFPFWTADEAYLNATDTSFTMVEMTTPAPSGGVSKRPSFDAHLNYQNRDVSARAEVIMRIQVKAESATGVSLGAVATVQDGIGEDSGSIVYKWYGISGNHLDKLGVGGEISTSSDGSTSTSTVQGVKYDGTYTYVLVDTDLDYSYSVGNTLYYSWTSFNSVGTFSTVATVFSSTVGETGFQENSMSVSVHGPKTTTGKDFRMTFSRVSGTTLHLLTTGSAGYIR